MATPIFCDWTHQLPRAPGIWLHTAARTRVRNLQAHVAWPAKANENYPGSRQNSSTRRSFRPVRKIIHVDMDAFYASVEQRDNPELRGKPVVVAWRGSRSVVCAASYEARAFGVRSAMPALRAERLCPQAVFVAPDFPRYRAVSREAREIFKLHTDRIEPLSLDEAYLDVSENKTGLATATLVARAIREQIRRQLNLTASAGVAPNKFLAKLASDCRKPDGLVVIPPQEIERFLLPLPVGRLPGVGKVNGEKLAKLGIATVGDLRNLEASALEGHFGRYGVRLYELARGIDENPVVPDRPTQSISAEDTFEHDMMLEELEPMIRRLAEKLWSASRKESRLPRTVVLKLKTSEFKILTRSYTPASPPSSPEELASIALKLRDRVDLGPKQRYRLVGVGLGNFNKPEPAVAQPVLFD
ncbi:MAG: DNA polymerase IV [Acidobacteria bacterium]|nr:DNA polymerase IV [Acidobacteriota bacterium]